VRGAPLAGFIVVLGLLGLEGASAQQPAPTRAGEPSRIEERLQRTPEAPGDVPLPAAPPAAAEAPTAEERPFVLAAVSVEGATVFAPADFAPLYEPFLGRSVGPAEIARIVEAIARKYREAGYLLSRAYAPAQDAALGVLRVEVLEGYVERVVFEGDPRGGRAQLKALAGRIRAERPLTLATLERYLLLIGDLPGVRAQPGVAPLGELSPAHELAIRIARDPAEGYAAFDNRGSRAVGRHVAQAAARLNGPLGWNDATTLRFLTVPSSPQELIFGQLREQIPLGSDGLTVAVDAWRSEIEAGGQLEAFDVDSGDSRIAVELSYPWIRRRDASLYLTAQLERRDSDQDVFGRSFFEDRIRSVRLGLRYFFDDGWGGSNLLGAVVSKGLSGGGASEEGDPLLSRFDGDPQYAKATFEAVRRQRIEGPLAAQLWLAGQASGSRMLSAEEFRLGGGLFGRAYDSSELVGDRGFGAALELQLDLPAPLAELSNLQAYAFWDGGSAWDDVAGAGTSRDSLASAGFGLRGALLSDIAAHVEAAKPLTRDVLEEGDDDWRLFFSVSLTF
jgi:hemolysin activation/secretion protein